MLAGAARRIAVIYGVVVGGAVVVAVVLGAAAGANLERAVAVGLYVAGAALLVGCFFTGVRGPLRGVSRTGETVPLFGAKSVRRATPDERSEATRMSLLLFVMGIVTVVLGSLADPSHRAF